MDLEREEDKDGWVDDNILWEFVCVGVFLTHYWLLLYVQSDSRLCASLVWEGPSIRHML